MVLGVWRHWSTKDSGFEFYEAVCSVINSKIGSALRAFLLRVLPDEFEEGVDPEMEWVRRSRCYVLRVVQMVQLDQY